MIAALEIKQNEWNEKQHNIELIPVIFSDLSCMNTAQGPRFIYEPPSYQGFSNNTGGSLSCSAHGVPSPKISWVDGSSEQVRQQFTTEHFHLK